MNPLVVLANSKPFPSIDENRPTGREHPCFGCTKKYETGKAVILNEQIGDDPENTRKVKSNSPERICQCKLTSDIQLDEIRKLSEDLSTEEKLYLEYAIDPVAWAEFELNWKARWYQEEILRCSSLKKVVRAGRRVGKSSALGVDILHKVATSSNFRALVVAPYQDQVDLLFENMDKLIEGSLTLKTMISRRAKHPSQRVELANGSAIVGSTAGVKTGAAANKIRGQDANGIWLDETDMLAKKDLESIMAILGSHATCSLWASGTPSGKREDFYNWCTDKKHRFKEFHYPSSVSPNWTKDIEEWFKATYSATGFAQEFMAEFGEEVAGVFPKPLVDASLQDYAPDVFTPSNGFLYGLGVDWNDTTEGVHMVLVGWNPADGKFWFIRKFIVSKLEFTQHKAVEKIIEINGTWNPSFIYVDQGFGNTQIEMLKTYGLKHPQTGILRKVKGIQMGGKALMRTPLGIEEKEIKPFIVNLTVNRFEQAEIVIPNTEYKGEGTEGLVDQIMKYRIKRFSPEGRPVYDSTPDHTLTAWMLAIYGFWMEHTELGRRKPVTSVGVLHGEKPKEIVDPASIGMVTMSLSPERIREKKLETSKKLAPQPRNLDIKKKTHTLSDLRTAQTEKTKLNNKIGKMGPLGFYNHIAKPVQKRKTF